MPPSFTVLTVCAANLCRSPMAEQLLVAELSGRSDVTVTSAGLHPLVGHDLDQACAAALRELGCPVTPHRARGLDPAEVVAADLVLCATRAHRAEVLALVPSAADRTFTMREFARLGSELTPAGEAGPRARVSAVAALRGRSGPPHPGADDLGDPFAAPYDAVLRCATSLRDAVRATVRILGFTAAEA